VSFLFAPALRILLAARECSRAPLRSKRQSNPAPSSPRSFPSRYFIGYSRIVATSMSNDYRVETAGSEFAVIDPWESQ
jgi:hypothetical protein